MPHVVCAGLLVADFFVPPLSHLPAAGELVSTDDFLFSTGGGASNTGFALRRQGIDVSVIGCVGDDMLGDAVLRNLRTEGIDTTAIRSVPGFGTSKTVILPVEGEDRRYIHTFGANRDLRASDLSAVAFAGADALHVGGFLLLPGLDGPSLAERLVAARRRGLYVVLDVTVPGDGAFSVDDVAPVLPLLDWFVANGDEARALTGETDPERQAAAFAEAGARRVAVTLGDRGAAVVADGEPFSVPALRVDVVEPSGAGDAFAAGLISGLLDGLDAQASVERGCVLGASAVTALGCHDGVLTRTQLDQLLPSR